MEAKTAETREKSRWTADDVPDQSGRVAVVTGANSGLGLETARVLAACGAKVVMACRTLDKAEAVADDIRSGAPGADLVVQPLDLTSLASIRESAEQIKAEHEQIDLLINNAGVMWTSRSTTADGFELQLGTNHLGHFAFTGHLIERLIATPDSRIVTVSSQGHRPGQIHFDDLQLERGYNRVKAYGQSKLANLVFTFELQRRLSAAGAGAEALAAHPGLTSTDLIRYIPSVFGTVSKLFYPLIGQSAAAGALPTLRAATDPSATGGEYYGPSDLFQSRGLPRRVGTSDRAKDPTTQRQLWEESERLTGVTYPI